MSALCVYMCVRERDVTGILSAAKSVFPERVKAKGQMGCEMVRGARRETHNTKDGRGEGKKEVKRRKRGQKN